MRGPKHRWLAAMVATTLLLAPACASAQPAPQVAAQATEPKARIAVTKHSGRFNNVQLRYTATVQEHFLRDDKGSPTATVTTIAYLRDGVQDTAARPVMFMFNGGPGASSSPLHMSAMGPKRRVGGSNSTAPEWELNPFSPIDTADLVF